MGFVIEKITVFVGIDPIDGDEGVISIPAFGGNELTVPAIAADPIRAKSLLPIVRHYCEIMGAEFKVIQFEVRKDVTEQWKLIK